MYVNICDCQEAHEGGFRKSRGSGLWISEKNILTTARMCQLYCDWTLPSFGAQDVTTRHLILTVKNKFMQSE